MEASQSTSAWLSTEYKATAEQTKAPALSCTFLISLSNKAVPDILTTRAVSVVPAIPSKEERVEGLCEHVLTLSNVLPCPLVILEEGMPLDLIEAVPTEANFPASIECLVKREKLKLQAFTTGLLCGGGFR